VQARSRAAFTKEAFLGGFTRLVCPEWTFESMREQASPYTGKHDWFRREWSS
jgi:hypothetical protein